MAYENAMVGRSGLNVRRGVLYNAGVMVVQLHMPVLLRSDTVAVFLLTRSLRLSEFATLSDFPAF